MSMPIIELCYKNDDLGDPMINNYHVLACKLATKEELAQIEAMSLKINDILVKYLKTKNIDLIDFKLEFGRDKDGKVILADELRTAASGIPRPMRSWTRTVSVVTSAMLRMLIRRSCAD